MHATRRFVYHFVSQLECVQCRTKRHRILRYANGAVFVPEDHSLPQLMEMLPSIDVWCEACAEAPTRLGRAKAKSPSRLVEKLEAAKVADIRVGEQIPSRYDVYRWDDGSEWTKPSAMGALKESTCVGCQRWHGPTRVKLYEVKDGKLKKAPIGWLPYQPISLHEMLHLCQSWIPLCNECYYKVLDGSMQLPNDRLAVNTYIRHRNIWIYDSTS